MKSKNIKLEIIDKQEKNPIITYQHEENHYDVAHVVEKERQDSIEPEPHAHVREIVSVRSWRKKYYKLVKELEDSKQNCHCKHQNNNPFYAISC